MAFIELKCNSLETNLYEIFFDWLNSRGLYDKYNGMHTYILEYEAGYPDMDAVVYERYCNKCRVIVNNFREDV